eukprot:8250897-Pyramimonas_sp.AAC.1
MAISRLQRRAAPSSSASSLARARLPSAEASTPLNSSANSPTSWCHLPASASCSLSVPPTALPPSACLLPPSCPCGSRLARIARRRVQSITASTSCSVASPPAEAPHIVTSSVTFAWGLPIRLFARFGARSGVVAGSAGGRACSLRSRVPCPDPRAAA